MDISVIITSYKEPKTIKKAIRQILKTNLDNSVGLEIIVVSPDIETITSAKEELASYENFKRYKVLKDKAKGKPAAINLAVKTASGKILIFTDGDMYIDEKAIPFLLKEFEEDNIAGVSGHPVSLDDRNTFWGFSSHLFCYGADYARARPSPMSRTTMSGYLYAIKMTRDIKKIFPILEDIRAEDAYISNRIIKLGYKTAYAHDAFAYVHFPKNLKDWIRQKKRSLGGNVQLGVTPRAGLPRARSILEDLRHITLPLKFASTPKEYLYTTVIYTLRLYLWIVIYIQHTNKSYSKGRWEQIKSSKL